MAFAVIDRTAVLIGGLSFDFPQTTVQLVEGKNTVFATANGITAAAGATLRTSTTVPLWELTVFNGVLQGAVDLRALGGVGNANSKSAPAGSTFTVTNPSATASGEGAAQAMVVVAGTIAGMTLDDTIAAVDVTWAQAGTNQWHPAIPAQWAPNSQTITATVHGVPVSQAYDFAFVVRDNAGNTYGPVLIGGASPTITAQALTSAAACAWTPNSVGNILADAALQYSTTSGGIKAWMTNAAGTSTPVWTLPTNPSTYWAPSAANSGSSSSPLVNDTGLSTSTPYWYIATLNTTSLTFTLTRYAAAPTDAQIAAALQDGSVLAVVATAKTSASITPSGTGTGGFTGGSGGGSGRPPLN